MLLIMTAQCHKGVVVDACTEAICLDALQIWVSSQSPQFMMQAIAMVLGLPHSRCTSRCRRMGGAFGGKTTRSAVPAAAVAVAANKLKKQV